jgi:hypothetical protein
MVRAHGITPPGHATGIIHSGGELPMRRYSPRCSRIQDITLAKTRFGGRGLPYGSSEAAEPSFIVRSQNPYRTWEDLNYIPKIPRTRRNCGRSNGQGQASRKEEPGTLNPTCQRSKTFRRSLITLPAGPTCLWHRSGGKQGCDGVTPWPVAGEGACKWIEMGCAMVYEILGQLEK